MSESIIFAQRMKEAREKRGLKQKELAEKVGVTPQTISAYEKTGKVPTLENAISIATALEVSLDWLCSIEDGVSKQGEFETLGDVARFLHKISFLQLGSVRGDCYPRNSFSDTPDIGIIFDNDEIGSFLSDNMKMQDLLYGNAFEQDFYDRWLDSRFQSLDKITLESYLEAKHPFF